jgi:hypothetical protein
MGYFWGIDLKKKIYVLQRSGNVVLVEPQVLANAKYKFGLLVFQRMVLPYGKTGNIQKILVFLP